MIYYLPKLAPIYKPSILIRIKRWHRSPCIINGIPRILFNFTIIIDKKVARKSEKGKLKLINNCDSHRHLFIAFLINLANLV